MNRWILQLFLTIAAAISPLLAAFVTPRAFNNPKANAASSVMNDRAPCLFNERIPREENNPHINATQPNEEPEKAPKRTKKPSDTGGLLFRQQQTADPFRADFRDSSEPRLMTTFAGGTSLMFEMIAKRMLDWGNEAKPFNLESEKIVTGVLPRWHPHPGISDANPDFRKLPPAMNNQGFAKSIWRNVRKRNKPSVWKNALRTYDRMAQLEDNASGLNIQRSNVHHEGAMLACSKLGLWQRALEIYHYVFQVEQESQAQFDKAQNQLLRNPNRRASSKTGANIRKSKIRRTIHVTDSMITSLVQACVVASRERSRNRVTHLSPPQEEQEAALRRIPLDTALEVLTIIQGTHNIPLVARHLNPLAAAYQSLGYISQSTKILQIMLSNRTAGEEPDDGVDIFNVNDLCAKDKGSYSLLVQGAVVAGDWGAAVDALSDMTEAGLHPKQRHCNLWSEISERQTRPRATGSWKKKRDDYWAESVR